MEVHKANKLTQLALHETEEEESHGQLELSRIVESYSYHPRAR